MNRVRRGRAERSPERTRDLVILGAGGPWALPAAEYAEDSGWRVRALVNNLAPEEVDLPACPYPIYQLGDLPPELLALPAFCCLVTPAARRRCVTEAVEQGMRVFARIIGPSSDVARSASVGEGSYVGRSTVVGPRARVERHVHLFSLFLGHHARVGSFATVAKAASVGSHCTLGEGCYVGMGAVIVPRIAIGQGAVVAAGAVVTRDVPDHCFVAGVPAVVKKERIPATGDLGGVELD